MRRIFASALLCLAATPAFADAPRAPALKAGAPISIAAYGRQNPQCVEWTDGCAVCVASAGKAQCSTPGIACTPAGLTCRRHKGSEPQ